MTGTIFRRIGTFGAVIALAVATPGLAPAAASPLPTIEPNALVLNAPVAPPEPTEQRTVCARPSLRGTTALTEPSPAQALLRVSDLWAFSRGRGQKVAVIDTGVSPHPRLRALRGGGDYVSTGDGTSDCDGHGTLVAGLIAASPSASDSFAGIAPEAQIIAIRQSSRAYAAKSRGDKASQGTMSSDGYGTVRTLAYAIVRAVSLGATIINISEVACGPQGTALGDQSLGAAVQYAHRRNVLVVAAAGNLSPQSPCSTQNPETNATDAVATVASPAYFDRYVLTVGAVNSADGSPLAFSLHGPWVDVAAPGTNIVSLDSSRGATGLVNALQGSNGPVPVDGTSFAAPYVAGLAALIRSRYPDLSVDDVIDRIANTAHGSSPERNPATGHGVIDPMAALTAAPTSYRSDTATTLAAQPDSTTPDRTPVVVALAGSAIAALILIGIWATGPRRRKLRPDEF